MGKKILVILILLLMVRPIALVENLACGEEIADPEPIPTQEIPCSDIVDPSEIVQSDHHCPCFALMHPDTAGLATNTNSFAMFAINILSAETAVATPPTPPPRLV